MHCSPKVRATDGRFCHPTPTTSPLIGSAWMTSMAHSRASNGSGFADLAERMQDEILHRAVAGKLLGRLNGAQMRRWFEDLHADAVKLYVAHPATLAGMGYSGIACAGDDGNKSGFTLVGLGEREAWEPLPNPPADPSP